MASLLEERKAQDRKINRNRVKSSVKANNDPTYNYLVPLNRFRDLGKQNSKRQGYMDVNKKQLFLKNFFNVTNPIANYYSPECHKRSWWPNGKYIVKKRYNYTNIGLEHFYEKNNVEQLKPIDTEEKSKKDSELTTFLEYENVAPGNFIISIEYCSSCEEHCGITQHGIENIFRELAIRYQKIIQERFPFIKVILKPADVDIVINKPFKMPKPNNGEAYPAFPYINEQFKQCRIGAFEIQISTKNEKGEIIKKLIHSKLKTKQFPNVKTVLDKIVSMMPLFNLNIVLFDQEDYQELDKMNGIEVNIYLSNSNTIRELSDSAKEQINNFISPGRRNEMLKRQKLIQAQTLNKFENESPLFTESRTILSGKSRRIYSTKSHFRTNNKSGNSNKKILNNSNKSYDIFSSNNSGPSSDMHGLNVNDYAFLKSQRGQLIKKQFSKINPNLSKEEYYDSSESVSVQFNLLPYDTYIVETKENCYFQSSITLLKFNEINTKDNGNVTKYIGLWHQQKAILNIHLYKEIEVEKKQNINMGGENNENASNENIENNENSENKKTIEQVPITSGTITISDADDPNSRYQVYSNSKGIYEYKTQPGEYKLEVYTKDFERDVRKIKLKCGLNTINIKLNPDKNCELEIEVLEYNESINDENDNENKNNMELIPVRNASVQIFKNSQDLLMEGITNKKGLMKYFVDKNDNNLSIKITKDGYFRAERYFKKYSTMKVNDKGNYISKMRFILVNQERLNYFKKILFICYANVNKKIFEFKYECGNQKNNIQIKDWQKEKGIFIATFTHEDHYSENQSKTESNSKKNSKILPKSKKVEKVDEKCTYEEIIRIGLQISPNSVKYDDDNNMDDFKVTDRDLIEYLKNICCEGNIYTPKSDFHINLPKVFNKININLKPEKSERSEILNINNNNNNVNSSQNENESTSKKATKRVINDLYWDLGWVDANNFIYYETSVFFDVEQKPNRLTYYECFVEFLQALIDKQVYNNLFDYFHFNLSILARGDRYLPKKIFEKKMLELIVFNSEDNENMIELISAINFVCNILCGYDEENNIRDDSISFNLLKKKVSSNIKNFIE